MTDEINLRPLFDVTMRVFGDESTGAGVYDVEIVDTYHKQRNIIGGTRTNSFDAALEFARGAVTAFMHGTKADE